MKAHNIILAVLSPYFAGCAPLFYSQMTVGTIELKTGAEQRIQLHDLPESRELVIGLNVSNCDLLKSENHVAILMKDESGHVVINEDRRLKDFSWMRGVNQCTPAFGYVRGEGRERPLNDHGDTCGEPIYTGADYGYGTYFKSRSNGVYTLVVKSYGGTDSLGSADIRLMDDGPFVAKGCS